MSKQPDRERAIKVATSKSIMKWCVNDIADAILEAKAEEAEHLADQSYVGSQIAFETRARAEELRSQKSDAGKGPR